MFCCSKSQVIYPLADALKTKWLGSKNKSKKKGPETLPAWTVVLAVLLMLFVLGAINHTSVLPAECAEGIAMIYS